MVREDTVARTPEQLDAWISEAPGVKESLQRGGYIASFTSRDLFPLLQVFIEQAGGPAPEVEAPPRPPRPRWLVGLGIALVLLAIAVLIGILR